MHDTDVVTALLESPWERMQRESAPIAVDGEVSEALAGLEDPRPLDEIEDPPTIRRVRVATDLAWVLEEAR